MVSRSLLVVSFGTAALGAAAGIAGSFLLLRGRALLADAASHATLPGIALGFMVGQLLGLDPRNPWLLLSGAALSAAIGTVTVNLLVNIGRLRDQAAIASVLGVFYGAGFMLLSLVQQSPRGDQAGLKNLLWGQSGSLLLHESVILCLLTCAIALASISLFKELRAICFDASWCITRGMPVRRLDGFLLGLVLAVVVLGLPSVGLLMVVALLVIPAAAARFWSDNLARIAIFAALCGCASGILGTLASNRTDGLPTGPVIVLAATLIFVISLVFAPTRGLLSRKAATMRRRRRTRRDHLLRALWELSDPHGQSDVPISRLQQERSWSPRQLNHTLWQAERTGLAQRTDKIVRLSSKGRELACTLVRNHRLWEAYLIHCADIAPSHVDLDADRIEHVLDESIIQRLLETLPEDLLTGSLPPSPHALPNKGGAS